MASRHKLHPIVDKLPRIGGEDRDELKADIREHGIQMPAVMWRGWVIDGRNRIEIAEELGIDCPTVEFGGDESGLPAFIASLNLHRRHLSSSQRAAIAVEIGMMDRNRGKKGGAVQGGSAAAVAAKAGTSRSRLFQAAQVRDTNRQLFDRVIAGELSLDAAVSQIKSAPAATAATAKPKSTKPTAAPASEPPPEPAADPVAEILDEPNPVDDAGNEVPELLFEAFDAQDRFRHLITKLRECRNLAREIAEAAGGEYFQPGLQQFEADIKALTSQTKRTMYYTHCPHCVGKGCSKCKEHGYASRGAFDNFPPDMKAEWSRQPAA